MDVGPVPAILHVNQKSDDDGSGADVFEDFQDGQHYGHLGYQN